MPRLKVTTTRRLWASLTPAFVEENTRLWLSIASIYLGVHEDDIEVVWDTPIWSRNSADLAIQVEYLIGDFTKVKITKKTQDLLSSRLIETLILIEGTVPGLNKVSVLVRPIVDGLERSHSFVRNLRSEIS